MTGRLRRRAAGGTSYLAGGDGHPVLFLHGVPGSALTWEPVAERLADRYRVLIPDLRGFGHSAPPDGDYYMEGQARATGAFLDAVGVADCSLVAHDFGGPVGLTTLRLFPGLDVRRLVLSATNLFTDTPVPAPLRVAGVPVLGTLAFTAAVGNRFGSRALYRAAVRRRGAVPWREFQRHLTPAAMATTRRVFQRSLADLPGNYADVEASLPSLSMPALVLWGDSDPFFPVAVGERTRAALPDADLTVYDRTGHFVPEERPGDVAVALADVLPS